MVEVAHLVGPVWSVDGRPVVVPVGDTASLVVMAHVASVVVAPGPWPVRVTDGNLVLDLMLGVDGSVTEPPAKPALGDKWWRR